MRKTTENSRIYGEGSVYWRPERKRWEAKKTVGLVTKREIRVQGTSRAECVRKMKEREAEYLLDEVTAVPEEIHPLEEQVREWLEIFKRGQLKDRSYDALEGVLRNQLCGSELGKLDVDEVTAVQIQKHINDLCVRKSVSTAKKTCSLLNQFYTYHSGGNPTKNPMLMVSVRARGLKATQEPKSTVYALSDSQMEDLSTELQKPLKNGSGGYKYGSALLFIMWSYVRVGEALALQWQDVDWTRRKVTINKSYAIVRNRDEDGHLLKGSTGKITTPKTRSGYRTIPLYHKALEALESIREESENFCPHDHIIVTQTGKIASVQQLNATLKLAAHNAGVPDVSVHDLRHTGISYFLRHGMDVKVVSALAGHSDVTTTMRIYYNLVADQFDDPYGNL